MTINIIGTYMTGSEMKTFDNKCHPDAKILTHSAEDLYDCHYNFYNLSLRLRIFAHGRVVAF